MTKQWHRQIFRYASGSCVWLKQLKHALRSRTRLKPSLWNQGIMCSVGFRSGLCLRQSNSSTQVNHFSSIYLQGALSSWNRKDPKLLPKSWKHTIQKHTRLSFYAIDLRFVFIGIKGLSQSHSLDGGPHTFGCVLAGYIMWYF